MLIRQDPEPVIKLPFKQVQCFRLCQFYTEVDFGCVFVFKYVLLFLTQGVIRLANSNQIFS